MRPCAPIARVLRKLALRPRRLVDVSKIDMSAEIFGAKYDSPIVIAPTGSNRAFHEDGERAVARAAKTGNHLQMLSTVASTSIEDAIAERGAPVWFQLYTTQNREVGEQLVEARRGRRRARHRADARCAVVCEMGDFRAAAPDRHAGMRQLPRHQRLSDQQAQFQRHQYQRRYRHRGDQPDLGQRQAAARRGEGQAAAQGHSRP